MTMTTPRPAMSGAPSEITWSVVQPGLWVGSAGGEFAGMIEAEWGFGFTATTERGQKLGRFPTIEHAQAAFRR